MDLSVDDVRDAAQRLREVARRTPVLSDPALDAMAGARVFAKAEMFQRGGAFKFRGAYNRLSRLSPNERRAGVVAASSGNHAQALAIAAHMCGTTATVIMPHDAPGVKRSAAQRHGAQVLEFNRYTEDRDELVADLANTTGRIIVGGYADPYVIAGAGTAALELMTDEDDLNAIVVPVGGGGLLAGTVLASQGQAVAPRIIAVEPSASDDWFRSWRDRRLAPVAVKATIADGLQIAQPGAMNFEIARDHLSDVVLVDDSMIARAMETAFEYLHVAAEPSGAAALAALLFDRVSVGPDERIGVILSGGNLSLRRLAEIVMSGD